MRLTLSVLAFLTLAPAAGAQRKIILFIGDGVGVSYWTATRYTSPDALAVSQFKVMGLVDTRASNNLITDSAAGATAYSAGVRTFNGAIGVAADSTPAETVLEAAMKQGWATGLVATSSITHATPASFASHVASRASEYEIAKQMTALKPDVMFGGGLNFFSASTRPDHEDLVAALRTTHTVITGSTGLDSLGQSTSRVVGLFAPNQMPAAPLRSPSLPEMTRKAIDILSRDAEGFFLMVEGSQPDWRGHSNRPIQEVIDEMRDYDAAIGVALEYQKRSPDVLILVVADHETGGLAIHTARDSVVMAQAATALNNAVAPLERAMSALTPQAADSADSALVQMQITSARLRANARGARDIRLQATYTTTGHTGQMIPMFASGPGAEAFGGMIDNYRVGQMLMEIVKRPAPARRRK